MQREISERGCLAILATVALAMSAAAKPPTGHMSGLSLPLITLADVPLGPATRRFDYESLDPRSGLLFIADLAGSRVVVVDVRHNRFVAAIDNVAGVHGVLAVPEENRVFATATSNDQIVAIDIAGLAIVRRTSAGHYPDGIAWSGNSGKLYVSDEHGRTIAVIDSKRFVLTKRIPIGGEVGNTQYDQVTHTVYTNDQSANELVAIDPKSDSVTARWKLPGCRGAHGLQLDAAHRRAYVACEDNAMLLAVSLDTHDLVASMRVGEDPDVLALDTGLRRLYVAGESGVVSVFDLTGNQPHALGEATLADNAHVVAVDQITHSVFFPLRNLSGRPALRIVAPSGR